MVETLTDAYLEQVAQTIDDACDACYSSVTDDDGKGNRSLINTMLTILGTQWDRENVQGSRFTNALKQNCATCLASRRESATLYNQFSCGIRRRFPENSMKPRSNAPSR